MAKLLDFITVPAARASILWLIGEYNEKVPKIAPDVLRKLSKTFIDEEDVVKLQALNLGLKLYLTNPVQTSLICQYVFTLARYDPNYDVRDRARFLRQFIFPSGDGSTVLSKNARNIFLAPKPAPVLESKYQGRDHFQLGSLSHYLNMRANGYNDLPEFPKVPSDTSIRNVESFKDAYQHTIASHKPVKHSKGQDTNLFSGSEKSSDYSNSESSSTDESSSCEEDESSVKGGTKADNPKSIDIDYATQYSESSTTSATESGSEFGESTSSDGSSSESKNYSERIKIKTNKVDNPKKLKSNLDLLLDLTDIPSVGPVMTPSLNVCLAPGTPVASLLSQNAVNRIDLVAPSFIDFNHQELLNKLSGNGLSATYRFTRSPHIFSSNMVSIEIIFMNHSSETLTSIQMCSQKALPLRTSINEFAPIQSLQPQQRSTVVLGIDFNDSTHAVEFEIQSNAGKSKISLKPPIGELIRSVQIDEEYFCEQRRKLRGMNEHHSMIQRPNIFDINHIKMLVFKTLNVARITCTNTDILYFVGQTMSSKSLVLISLELQESEISFLVNCEKMVIGSMVLSEIRHALTAEV